MQGKAREAGHSGMAGSGAVEGLWLGGQALERGVGYMDSWLASAHRYKRKHKKYCVHTPMIRLHLHLSQEG